MEPKRIIKEINGKWLDDIATRIHTVMTFTGHSWACGHVPSPDQIKDQIKRLYQSAQEQRIYPNEISTRSGGIKVHIYDDETVGVSYSLSINFYYSP